MDCVHDSTAECPSSPGMNRPMMIPIAYPIQRLARSWGVGVGSGTISPRWLFGPRRRSDLRKFVIAQGGIYEIGHSGEGGQKRMNEYFKPRVRIKWQLQCPQ